MKKFLHVSLLAAALLPALAFAQTSEGIGSFIDDLGTWVDDLLPVVFTIAILVFFWGIAKFIFSAGDEGKRSEGRQLMIWGVIAIAVMASVFGLADFLRDTFGVTEIDSVTVPTVN